MATPRRGTLALPDGTVCIVEERPWSAGKLVPRYEAPAPWARGTWLVVPTDKRDQIVWEVAS